MEAQCYNIRMKTPIGVKYGKMTIDSTYNEKISGHISLMNHCEPFTGTINESGYCHITGNIITLIKKIKIEADGRIYNGKLKFSVKERNNILEIIGTKCENGVEVSV